MRTILFVICVWKCPKWTLKLKFPQKRYLHEITTDAVFAYVCISARLDKTLESLAALCEGILHWRHWAKNQRAEYVTKDRNGARIYNQIRAEYKVRIPLVKQICMLKRFMERVWLKLWFQTSRNENARIRYFMSFDPFKSWWNKYESRNE